ncbi:MAG: radical SAM protein [Verrucomicrobia bacterium]|nr:radical SAM protein [Verrucomicrobiota bacterium]
MCHIWMHPTHPAKEVTLETLKKLLAGIDYLNLTGGEPTLRKDLAEIVDLLYPKARMLEISTNGLDLDKLEPIIRKYPCIKIRISMEGGEAVNDAIRGEPGGFAKKKETMRRLMAAGGKDLGFATTIQDENADELVPMFRLCTDWGIELATSSLHNGFRFHKSFFLSVVHKSEQGEERGIDQRPSVTEPDPDGIPARSYKET